MNRRTFIGGVAAASLATVATQALAHEGHDHHGHHGHHHGANKSKNPYEAVRLAAAECYAAGQNCVSHCIRLITEGDTSMNDCVKSASQMVVLCHALQLLAGQVSALTPAVAKSCIQACKECAAACKQHVGHHEECTACYEACLACIKACEKIA